MLVPKISSRAVDPKLLQKIALLPAVLYTDAQQAIQASQLCDTAIWADAQTADVKDLLNNGLSMAIVSAADSSIDASRIAVRFPAETVARQGLNAAIDTAVAEGVGRAGAVIIGLTAEQIAEGAQLTRLCDAASAKIVGADGPVRVLVELSDSTWTEDLLRSVACTGANPVVDAEQLEELGVAAAIFAGSGLASDRDDGLVTTVVVDEQRVCLGVVYSNQTSLQAALDSGEGVYWSRKRGLWHKGLTSGATQTLLGISIDCDADALCFRVQQHGAGFCHRNVRSCFGPAAGLNQLAQVVAERREKAPKGSYTKRLFEDAQLLRAKLLEEATELADATTSEDVAFEAADLLYFAMVKCAAHGVSLRDVERSLDFKHRKVIRRPGNAKPQFVAKKSQVAAERTSILSADIRPAAPGEQIRMRVFAADDLSPAESTALLQRPIIDSEEIMGRVRPIVDAVRANGDAAVLEFTAKFDRVKLDHVVERAPFAVPDLPANVRAAIDQAYANVHKFHSAQLGADTCVETMPGVKCARFSRAIERVGLYVPGGTAVLPSSALMLGVPAQVAGCREIVLATPPRADGTIVPEVLYVAHKVGASAIVKAGGAQAIAAMAYGTETVPKVDKICGPGNQYVTAAKMLAQNDTAAMVSIDMPAGPSEVLVVADASSNPAYVASDLLSQAEHGPDSQVVLLAVGLNDLQLAAIENEVHAQASRLPRVDIVRQSIPKSFCLRVSSMQEAMQFSNAYGPEHLILHNDRAADYVADVINAGSVFVGPYSPESCGDYASGTNHTLPTYGFSKMYSGVNTGTFLKHITSQELTREGLANIGQTVMTLAEVEELEAHRNAVAIRLRDME
ncbi:trifunctional histidinol dehydrogenase [Coemansia brasiliensis]|uniref:Histidine biosynthesis trifunctional protein n=1 Tax=Coemansia brasiliensis TaxID=2650707 RepID=A0A9W8IH37_9FUNG|nr:trifunctional histidinol dehydrogenase [Coemansia brasiliensis]